MSSSTVSSSLLYPTPSEAGLASLYVGKDIAELDGPAAIVDRAIVRRNCDAMLDTVDRLDCFLRAHVKTHKVQICLSSTHSKLYH